jgi:hypothetical protein
MERQTVYLADGDPPDLDALEPEWTQPGHEREPALNRHVAPTPMVVGPGFAHDDAFAVEGALLRRFP